MSHSIDRVSVLDESLKETYDWLGRVSLELDDDDPHLALGVLRAVLHALRDRLTVEHSAHLTAQFPTFVRGLYFEQWTPDIPNTGRGDSFLFEIERGLRGYENRCSAEAAARAVFAVLEESLSGGADKIKWTLPKAIRALWD